MLVRSLLGALALSMVAGLAGASGGGGIDSFDNHDGSATVTVGASDVSVRPGGSASGGAARPGCARSDGTAVPCQTDLGWWSNTFRCYLTKVQDAPAEDPSREGEAMFRCDPGPLGWDAGPRELFLWLPVGAAAPDPRVLASSAIESMRLEGIRIGMAPPQGAWVLVNMPMWLWADQPGARTWGPAAASASAGSVTVNAVARAASVEWSMGDGTTVVCGSGVAYPAALGDPDACSHTYRAAGTRQVEATTTWRVEWSATTGERGSESLQTSSTTTVEVREAAAQVTDRD